MKEKKIIKDSFKRHLEAFSKVNICIPEIIKSSSLINDAVHSGSKILIAGNGGSASDAQHFAAEFIGRFVKERKSFPAISLSTDTSAITAISNDYGYENVFSRQIDGLGKKGDIFIGISTSGNSENIIMAIKKSKEIGLKTITLTGNDGGKMKTISDFNINIADSETARIQEVHIFILHIFCQLFEHDF